MSQVGINFSQVCHDHVWAHLLSNSRGEEEAAFLFARAEAGAASLTFQVLESYLVRPADLVEPGRLAGIELTDACRAMVLKRAHDLDSSLIECHSHPGSLPAEFSMFDLKGFTEFVPHVWWRLRGRPYAALVVAEASFDALAWIESNSTPVAIDVIAIGDRRLYPTRRSLTRWKESHRGLAL